MQIHIDVCSKMKQFRDKLAQRKGKLGFCREFAPIKWGGCDPLREPETCIVLEQTSAKAKTVQSVASKWLSSGSHKQNTASSESKFKHVCHQQAQS